MPATSMRASYTLYRFWDSHDGLLYVGRTINFVQRWSKHLGVTDWWQEIARITIEHFPDVDSLDAAEFEAIRVEKPRYNVRGRGGINPDRKTHACVTTKATVTGTEWAYVVSVCRECGAVPEPYRFSIDRGVMSVLQSRNC